MKQKYGIILLEKTEVIVRIYETGNKEWKLLHYQSEKIKQTKNPPADEIMPIIEILNELFFSEHAQHVGEWKASARFLPDPLIQTIESATGLNVESLTYIREQELLCKGMFTELW